MRLRVRAPATSANLGPGFDCAAVALDLWNELELSPDGPAPDPQHLAVRAFALVAPPEGHGFAFVDRVPRARGLGSSAATVALGLVAGALAAGRTPDPEELLALGTPLEGHADNLAAALAGGVCLTWDGAIAKLADSTPLTPVAVIPQARVSTSAARASLPESVPFRDAAHTAARAALLGAALARGSASLLAAAADDRLHEPYRAANAPLLAAVRADPPAGALASTLSGSGPTVLVWAEPDGVETCARELAARFPDAHVRALRVSPLGAGAM